VVRDLRSKGVRLPRPWAVGAIVGFDVAMPGLTVPRGTTAGDALVRTHAAWHAGRRATRSPPAPAGGFLWDGRVQEAPGGNPGTPGVKTIPPSMPHDGTGWRESNPRDRPGVQRPRETGAGCQRRARRSSAAETATMPANSTRLQATSPRGRKWARAAT